MFNLGPGLSLQCSGCLPLNCNSMENCSKNLRGHCVQLDGRQLGIAKFLSTFYSCDMC